MGCIQEKKTNKTINQLNSTPSKNPQKYIYIYVYVGYELKK